MAYRFISADTTEILSASTMVLTDKNLYAYCDNNPINRADGSGRFWGVVAVGAGLGFLLGGLNAISSGDSFLGGAIEGALLGGVCSACGLKGGISYILLAGAVAAGIDIGRQMISHIVSEGNTVGFKVNIGSVVDTSLQAMLGVAIPSINCFGNEMIDAVATTLLWGESSVLVGCLDMVGTYYYNTKKENNVKQHNSVKTTKK